MKLCMRIRDCFCDIFSIFDFFSYLRETRNAFIGFHDLDENDMFVWLNGNPIGSNVRIMNYGGKHITEYFQTIFPEECLCTEITSL